MDCSMPGLPVHHQLPEFTETHVHWLSHAIQPSHPLSSPSPPTFNLAQHQGLSNESVLHIRWPKYWSFSFNISPSNEYSGLMSFRIDQLDLLAVQVTLKSLLQHHSSKASILQDSAIFIVQLSHPCMTTGKTIAFIRWTFVGKGMSLLFYMWSGHHHFMANRWGNNGNSDRLYFLGLQKSLQMVTVAMKSKDACSLEEKLSPMYTAY